MHRAKLSGDTGRAITAILVDGKICAERSSIVEGLLAKGYGVEDTPSGYVTYSYPEALYLIENGWMKVVDKQGVELDFNKLLEELKQLDENVWRDYVIYRDLRKRKYVVKDGFNEELRFRVFERGKYGEEPAKYIVAPVVEGRNLPMKKLQEWLMTCRSMRKELVIAVVDRRNEVVYYMARLVDLRNL